MPAGSQLCGLVSDPSNALVRSYSIGHYANPSEDIKVCDPSHSTRGQSQAQHGDQCTRAAQKYISDLGEGREARNEDRARALPAGPTRLSQFSLMNGGGVQTISEGLDGDEKHLAGVLQQSSFGDAGHSHGPHAEVMLPFAGIGKK